MSPTEQDPNLSTVHYPEEVGNYLDLLHKTNQLITKHSGVSGLAKQALDAGLSALDNQISILGDEPTVVNWFQTKRDEALETLAVTQDLQGILPEEELNEVTETARTTLDVFNAFTLRHGLDGVEASFVPTDKMQDKPVKSQILSTDLGVIESETKELSPKTAVNLTLVEGQNGTILRVGEKGRIIRLRGKNSEKLADYTDFRKQVIKLLCASEGSLSIEEIKAATGLDLMTEREKHNHLNGLKKWITGITYRRSPLFVHNNNTGNSSRYSINPMYSLTLSHESIKHEDKDNSSPITLITTTQIKHNVLPQSTPSLRQATVLLGFLGQNNNLLAHLGIPVPTESLQNQIDDASDKEDRANQVNRCIQTHDEIEEERKAALLAFRNLFADQTTMEVLLTNLSVTDPLYKVLEYTIDIDSEETWKLLTEQVLQAVVSRTVEFGRQGEGKNRPAVSTTKISLPDGRTFVEKIDFITNKESFQESELVKLQSSEDSTEIVLQTPNTSVAPRMTEQPIVQTPPIKDKNTKPAETDSRSSSRETTSANSNTPETSVKHESKRLTEEEKKKIIGNSINELAEHGLLDSRRSVSNQLISIKYFDKNIMGTDEATRRLEAFGILKIAGMSKSTTNLLIEPYQLVAMHLQNSYGESWFSNKAIRRKNLRIIKNCLESYYVSRGL